MKPRPPIFFTHIPRSGGASLIEILGARIPTERTYPNRVHDDPLVAKISPSYLLNLPRTRLTETDLFAPHMPHAISTLLDVELLTVTVLRDPVERVRSVLDLTADEPVDSRGSLEKTYAESEWASGWFVANQLAYYLGTTADAAQIPLPLSGTSDDQDRFRHALGSVDALVTTACRTLETIDAVGLTEHLDDLLTSLERRLGVAVASKRGAHANRGRGRDLTPALRRRIEASTEADREIYDHARNLLRHRHA